MTLIIDLLTQSKTVMNVDDRAMPMLHRALANAEKFELGTDFAQAAEELAADFKAVRMALPYCRLPYPTTWIEVAQANRPRFSKAPIHLPGIQHVPLRVGFLMTAVNAECSIISTQEFWVMPGETMVQMSHIAMLFDPRQADDPREPQTDWQRFFPVQSSEEWNRADKDTQRILNNVIRPMPNTLADPLLTRDWGVGNEIDQISFEIGAIDWSGETAFLLAVLALLNTLNATKRDEVNRDKINAKRVKLKKPPLNNHYILTIHPRIKRSMKDRGRDASAGEVRAHLVRGHFKVRKTGIYWWRPHARGHEGPPIDKSYRVD